MEIHITRDDGARTFSALTRELVFFARETVFTIHPLIYNLLFCLPLVNFFLIQQNSKNLISHIMRGVYHPGPQVRPRRRAVYAAAAADISPQRRRRILFGEIGAPIAAADISSQRRRRIFFGEITNLLNY
jgi:hypothetical protein